MELWKELGKLICRLFFLFRIRVIRFLSRVMVKGKGSCEWESYCKGRIDSICEWFLWEGIIFFIFL